MSSPVWPVRPTPPWMQWLWLCALLTTSACVQSSVEAASLDAEPETTPDPLPLKLPDLTFAHPYQRDLQGAIEVVSNLAPEAFTPRFTEACGVDANRCSVYTVQQDAQAIEAARHTLQSTLRDERRDLEVRLLSAWDEEGQLRVRFAIHGPRPDPKERRITVKGNSAEFVHRVVRAARKQLPRYLGHHLEVWCTDDSCGVYVAEEAPWHVRRVSESIQRACDPLQCRVQLGPDPRDRYNRARGSILITRYLERAMH